MIKNLINKNLKKIIQYALPLKVGEYVYAIDIKKLNKKTPLGQIVSKAPYKINKIKIEISRDAHYFPAYFVGRFNIFHTENTLWYNRANAIKACNLLLEDAEKTQTVQDFFKKIQKLREEDLYDRKIQKETSDN